MNTNIGISESDRQAVTDELTKILADEYVLYTKTRNAHWNIVGVDFYGKHKFFEAQFEELNEFIDSIAERISSLGQIAPASLRSFLDLTQLTESNPAKRNSKDFIVELLADHEIIIKSIRQKINSVQEDFNDLGTADFLTGLMQDHEKMAWFLRSHL